MHFFQVPFFFLSNPPSFIIFHLFFICFSKTQYTVLSSELLSPHISQRTKCFIRMWRTTPTEDNREKINLPFCNSGLLNLLCIHVFHIHFIFSYLLHTGGPLETGMKIRLWLFLWKERQASAFVQKIKLWQGEINKDREMMVEP